MRSTPGVAFFGFEPVESHVMSCGGAITTADFDCFESHPSVVAGLVPATPSVKGTEQSRSGWPGQARPRPGRDGRCFKTSEYPGREVARRSHACGQVRRTGRASE